MSFKGMVLAQMSGRIFALKTYWLYAYNPEDQMNTLAQLKK
jgi:hypothetical protein